MDKAESVDVRAHNRDAWDRCVADGNMWTVPVASEAIAAARAGHVSIVLTPQKPIPPDWFPSLEGCRTLCLAGAGGQQAPILAAAGARVTVYDNSPAQLGQDKIVADREGLRLEYVEGDMADLSRLADRSFDLIVHPCSNVFVPHIRPVWRECARVLTAGGILLAGFVNPVRYIFDWDKLDAGELEVRHTLPYSDLTHLSPTNLERIVYQAGRPLEWAHTLEDQIGGQLDAGLMLTGFYEDRWAEDEADPLSRYMDSFIATRSIKTR
jgi:SAM-dependent methyltransferase